MTAATFGSPFYCPLYVHWPFSEVLIACRERPELRAFSPFANDPGRAGFGSFSRTGQRQGVLICRP